MRQIFIVLLACILGIAVVSRVRANILPCDSIWSLLAVRGAARPLASISEASISEAVAKAVAEKAAAEKVAAGKVAAAEEAAENAVAAKASAEKAAAWGAAAEKAEAEKAAVEKVAAEKIAAKATDGGLGRAVACLNLTGGLNLAGDGSRKGSSMNASEAERHFLEMNATIWKKWSPPKYWRVSYMGEIGPGIEDFFIKASEDLWHKRGAGTTIRDIFGPYIPLLFRWNYIWKLGGGKYPKALIEYMKQVMRPDVLYVATSANDQGLSILYKDFPNLLVLSAGGYGHVPVPLLLGRARQLPTAFADGESAAAIAGREYFISYCGDFNHAPRRLREQMRESVLKFVHQHPDKKAFLGKSTKWKEIMAISRFSLVPRGFGRTAFHLIEVLQSGLIPVFIYDDVAWVPYRDLLEKIGFVVSIKKFAELLPRLASMPAEEIALREMQVRAHRDTHFMPTGITDQMHRFLLGGETDLRCVPLPHSIRNA